MNEKFNFIDAVKTLFKYSKNNKKLYIKSVVFMILFTVSEMLYKTFISKFLANMVNKEFEIAFNLIILCALFRIFGITFCHNQYRKCGIIAGEKISANLQEKLYKKIMILSSKGFKNIGTGKILTIIKSCESNMVKIIDSLLQESAYVFSSFVMLIVIYIIDYKLALGITLICGISLYLFKFELSKSKKSLNDEYKTTDEYTKLIYETSKGINDIKALNFEEKCNNIFYNNIENLKKTRTHRRLLGKTINTSKWTVRTIIESLLLMYILKMIQLNVYSTELAMLLVTYMDNIIDDVFHRIIEHDFEIAEFTANIKRVKDILESDDTEKFGEENYQIKGQIDIENLTFKYDTSKNNVLRNINISIKPHTQNAIVGLSGVGKTTIFKLLTKELTDYTGKIEFDGIEINKLNKESFRKSISIVNQEPILFNMSIKENLLMANESATDKEIIDACKLANIDSYIEELPNKYNEIITENSTNFSVGQKQRLAIARAILRDTPIILFDESTSALDNYSKNKIKETMKELTQNKTIIIISHTLDLVKDCDNIIYIEDGQILEGGNHNTLIEEKGKYYELINNSI